MNPFSVSCLKHSFPWLIHYRLLKRYIIYPQHLFCSLTYSASSNFFFFKIVRNCHGKSKQRKNLFKMFNQLKENVSVSYNHFQTQTKTGCKKIVSEKCVSPALAWIFIAFHPLRTYFHFWGMVLGMRALSGLHLYLPGLQSHITL